MLVSYCLDAYRHARIGMTSARNFPGTITVAVACDASRFALKNRSSTDLMSIPYAVDNIMAPGMLWELGDP